MGSPSPLQIVRRQKDAFEWQDEGGKGAALPHVCPLRVLCIVVASIGS